MGRTSDPQSHDLSGVRSPLTMPVSTLPVAGLSFTGLPVEREESPYSARKVFSGMFYLIAKSRIRKRHSVKKTAGNMENTKNYRTTTLRCSLLEIREYILLSIGYIF